MHGRIIDAGLRFADFKALPVQPATYLTSPDFQRGHIFVHFNAGFQVGSPIGFCVYMGGFGSNQAFSVLVGLAHFSRQGGRHDVHAFSLDQSLGQNFPGIEQQRLFVPPQAVRKHRARPRIRHDILNSCIVYLCDFVEKSGSGLYVVAFFVISFGERFSEFFLHLGDAFVKKVIQNQVDLALQGFQAGNGTICR